MSDPLGRRIVTSSNMYLNEAEATSSHENRVSGVVGVHLAFVTSISGDDKALFRVHQNSVIVARKLSKRFWSVDDRRLISNLWFFGWIGKPRCSPAILHFSTSQTTMNHQDFFVAEKKWIAVLVSFSSDLEF